VKFPNFIAVLRMMRLEGAKSMTSEDAEREKRKSSPVVSYGNIPGQIKCEEGIDCRLVGFPTNLLYSQLADRETDAVTAKFLFMMCAFDPTRLLADKEFRKKLRAVWYYPDKASYIEDEQTRQMQYTSRKPNTYSITVTWSKVHSRWETRKYKGGDLIRFSFGEDYRLAMWQTTYSGPQYDETLDTE
jgi:hypothetical protein